MDGTDTRTHGRKSDGWTAHLGAHEPLLNDLSTVTRRLEDSTWGRRARGLGGCGSLDFPSVDQFMETIGTF